MGVSHSLFRSRGHHDGCHMQSRTCLPFQNIWFNLWFFWRFMLSCQCL